MSPFIIFMLVLGLSSSIYLIVSAMLRVIERQNQMNVDKKFQDIQKQLYFKREKNYQKDRRLITDKNVCATIIIDFLFLRRK
jgi:hypothetical protein